MKVSWEKIYGFVEATKCSYLIAIELHRIMMKTKKKENNEPVSKLWIHNAKEQKSALTIEETHKSACYARNTILHLWLASLWSRVYNRQESWRNWFALVGSRHSFHACNFQSYMRNIFKNEREESKNAGRNKMHWIFDT